MKKGVTRIIASLLTAVMIIVGMGPVEKTKAADKPQFTVKTSSSAVKPGDEIKVELWLGNGGNIVAAVGNLEYDVDTFEMVGKRVVEGQASLDAESALYDYDYKTGSISVLLTYEEPYNAGGLVCTITLKVKDNPTGDGKIGYDFKGGETGTDPENPTTIEPGNDNADVSVEDENGNKLEDENVVVNIPLESIVLNKEAFTMARGTEDTLTVTATPENALKGKTIQWTTSNDKVVSVDNNGKIKAIGKGKATVTAQVEDKTTSVEITVNVPLTSIWLNQSTLTLRKGATDTLTVQYDPEDTTDDKTVTWSSSDKTVATVDANGKVTALKDGTAVLTAKVGNKTATCNLTVKEVPLTGISLDKTSITLAREESQSLEVEYTPVDTTDDKAVTWISSNENVATVKNGVVTGKSIGEATITAKVGTHTATCNVTVNAPLEGISLNPMTVSLLKNQTSIVKVTFDPVDTTDSKAIEWTIDHPEVAEITENGDSVSVKGKAQGKAVLTAETTSGLKATCVIEVIEKAITQIKVTPEQKKLEVGDTVACNVTYLPEDTTDDKKVTWMSTNEDVAVVDEQGVVTAVGGGKADVIAKTANGATSKCQITVPIHLTGISLETTTIDLLRKQKSDPLVVIYTPANTDDDTTVRWESSNPEVATVDNRGQVTGLKEGTATITATSKTGGFQATCIVNVTEIHLEGISLDEAESTEPVVMYKGQKNKLNVRPRPANTTDDFYFIYSSSDETVATVSEDGTVNALKAGETDITVQAVNGMRRSGGLSVTYTLRIEEIALENISFKEEVTSLEEGKTAQLNIKYDPENTTDDRTVVWSSSDEKVATVENGLVKALKAGKTVISARVGEKEISYELTVVAKKAQTDNNKTQSKDNKTTQTGTVQTGDPANVFSVMLTLLLAFTAIVVVLIYKDRTKRVHR